MNNAFMIQRKNGFLPWILGKVYKKHGVDIMLETLSDNACNRHLSHHHAPIDTILPFFFYDIGFKYNLDARMFDIIVYEMPSRAVFN